MIRKINQNNTTLRNISTSNENNKIKKSTSASSKNKINLSSMCNSMTSSIKKNRVDNSKSNKKPPLINSNSNKSLKVLRQNTHLKQNQATKKKDKENRDQGKKGTIMVKNIKNKIVGNNPLSVKTMNNNTNHNKDNIKNKDSKIQLRAIPTDHNNAVTTPRNKNINKSMNITMVNNRESVNSVSCENLSMDLFEVGRKLGKGRFGDVYMAREIKTGFALAIKVIKKNELKQSQMESQLVQQIKIQMYSNHPNILKMYGFFSDENKIYLLLELATNGCLFKEIRQKAYFQEDLACYYFRQVSSGIRYLHSHSIIHRDIKPENILNCFNVLKICDFGWAIYSPIYQRQTFCGTLDYVPPEIVTGDFYDEKADVWCLGVLCYELCTGKAPFESRTDENETYDKILKVEIQFPIYMSPQVVDFINKILNREPQKRINLQQIQTHEWMRSYENESGRMISKEIWDSWMKLNK